MALYELTGEQVKQLINCIDIANKTLGISSAASCLQLVGILQRPMLRPKTELKPKTKPEDETKPEEVKKETPKK